MDNIVRPGARPPSYKWPPSVDSSLDASSTPDHEARARSDRRRVARLVVRELACLLPTSPSTRGRPEAATPPNEVGQLLRPERRPPPPVVPTRRPGTGTGLRSDPAGRPGPLVGHHPLRPPLCTPSFQTLGVFKALDRERSNQSNLVITLASELSQAESTATTPRRSKTSSAPTSRRFPKGYKPRAMIRRHF